MPSSAATAAAHRLAVAAIVLAAVGPAEAETATLTPSADNTLYESASGSLSNGAGAYLFAGNTGSNQTDAQNTRRALLRFDVAGAVPAGATVTAASLTLRASRVASSAARTLGLHRATTAWGEGSSNDTGNEGDGTAAQSGDATWLHTFHATGFWASPGGDFVASASASQSVTTSSAVYTWTSSAMATDVQGWLDTPSSNHGWIVLGDESTSATAKRFDSREATTAANRPTLIVTYTPPPATGACCAASGACSVVSSASCSAGGGSYQGDGASCAPNPCPQPTGACCLPAGTCAADQTLAACLAASGIYNGDGTACASASCGGACCLPGSPGSCADAHTASSCTTAGGGFLGPTTTCGVDLCPFVDALPIPAVATPVSGVVGGVATYDLAMTQLTQQLHRDLPATTVWGYGGTYPGPTIEATADDPVTVVWRNQLPAQHLLAVDTCLAGPDVHGDASRAVVHLHGGHTPAAYDGHPERTLAPGESATYVYPNQQLPATLWYHDHAMGVTRLNVYAGLAGMYIVRDAVEVALGLPSGANEVPLVIQDRDLAADGSLEYPEMWMEHFFGDLVLVNGKVWPYLEVPQGKLRFRVLNGSNSRVYTLALSDGATFHVLGGDGGLLPAPVPKTAITLTPGERADVVVDFAGYGAGTELELVNSAPAPYPGTAGVGVVARVMQFRVGAAAGHTAALPSSLRARETLDEGDAVIERSFELQTAADACGGAAWLINGLRFDDLVEMPVLGDTEVWRFLNRSGVTHPMHLHLVMFQILDRQGFTVVDGEIVPSGSPSPPAAHEAGWKDTVAVGPSEIVRVIARFEDHAGLFTYHCHTLEHEDNEMMRQFRALGPIFRDGFESNGTGAWSARVPPA